MPSPVVVQVVTSSPVGASNVRLVVTDTGYVIETRSADALGGDRWTTDSTIITASRLVSGASAAALSALLASYQANLVYFAVSLVSYRMSRNDAKTAYTIEQRSTDAIGAERWATVHTIAITTSTAIRSTIPQDILSALLTEART